jgi:hypothetical protein
LIRPCWQKAPPPQSLHSGLRRPCGQTEPPPHSLHRYLIRPCWQMEAPPHSLQCDFRRPCWQLPPQPYCLHFDFWWPRSQMEAPPHCLHRDFIRPCWHFGSFLLAVSFDILILSLLFRNGAGCGCGNVVLLFLIIGGDSRLLNSGAVHLFTFLSSSNFFDEISSCGLALSSKTPKETAEVTMLPVSGIFAARANE